MLDTDWLSGCDHVLMLYSPRYPVNIKFQGAAAKLSYFIS